ncbi:MAG: serine/threonine-protein kinase [Pirellulales bacterium]
MNYFDDPATRTIAGYELRERIHRSPSGTLYRAYSPLLGREALVKTHPRVAPCADEQVRRFQREIQLVAKLTHPNLVRALHAGVEQDVMFLILQHVDGLDLETRVLREGPLDVALAVDYIRQAARGLDYLHQNQVIHRNVKPANLLVDSHGTLRIASLASALVDSAATDNLMSADLTLAGRVVGSADYLAPEQAFDSHSADARSDIYGLGCTLHFLLVGQPPYPADGSHRAAANHLRLPIPSLCQFREDVSPDLDAVFQKMLAKMADARYANMGEVEAELERVSKGISPRQTAVLTPSKWLAPAAAILGVTLGAITIWAIRNWLN